MNTWLGNMITAIKNVFSHEVGPWVLNLLSQVQLDLVAALKPLALEAVSELPAEVAQYTSGDTNGALKAFNATVAGTLQKAEAAGLQVGIHDLTTAASAALAAQPASP